MPVSKPGPHVTDAELDTNAMLTSLLAEAGSRRRQEEEARRLAEEREQRLREHAARRERLAGAFAAVWGFPEEENEQGRKPSPEGFRRWAPRFTVLAAVMRECDQAIPSLRLQERLRAVASTRAPAAMKYACVLLLLASDGDAGAVAAALAQAFRDGELRRFVLWLPYILDNLWQPFPRENGRIEVAEVPDGTNREEMEQAGSAFGWRTLSLSADPPGMPATPTADTSEATVAPPTAASADVQHDERLVMQDEAMNVSEATGSASPTLADTIVWLGDRVYKIGDTRQLVNDSEDCVLQAFLGDANRPAAPRLPEPDLRARSGVNDPAKVLRSLKKKYGGLFDPAIDPPPQKGAGWGVRITRAAE
jgi:hypothetical protein